MPSSVRRRCCALVGLALGCREWPYRPPGVPGRLRGRAEIRRHLTAAAQGFVRFDGYRDVVLHESTDPEVTIVEYEAHGTVVATGAPFRQLVIPVFRVRNGQILTYRDYINPLPLIEALAGVAPARAEAPDPQDTIAAR